MADKYKNFADLAAHEVKGVDYQILPIEKQTPIAVVAPHGGHIEPGTSEVAATIAGNEYSLYCFEGLTPGRPHRDLHIESSSFDELNGLRIATSAEVVVGVHGRCDREDPDTVWLGGLDEHLRDAIEQELKQAGFRAQTTGHHLQARNSNNICNRGKTGAGVQLEIPKALRVKLRQDSSLLNTFATAVRNALKALD